MATAIPNSGTAAFPWILLPAVMVFLVTWSINTLLESESWRA